ncbi:MAG TPA: TlpA disulfide reductase family protein [Acidobacteriaceae bacterium]|nr:TlpA disulfide reductase family protein [Acidobacteriaceae bacterium]
MNRVSVCVTMAALLAPAVLWGQAKESSVKKDLKSLSAPSGMPGGGGASADKPAKIIQLSKDIASLPAGEKKIEDADQLAAISTQGENGKDAMQAAADTLAAALKESPQPAGKDGEVAHPYLELARMARYAGVKTSLNDPMMDQAAKTVLANEADVAKADFTLKNLDGKKVTLSELKGKIVLIDFFSMACPSCVHELQDLELIHEHYAKQGLVILSITDDNPAATLRAISRMNYQPQVLTDDGGKVAKEFHTDGVPRTFVFNRDGKLIGESLDTCTQRQFFAMLGAAGLQPEQR